MLNYGYNFLNSCEPNGILFTNGDLDTYPVLYMQKINNIGVQSEQLKNNGRIPESNKSISSLHLPKQGEN